MPRKQYTFIVIPPNDGHVKEFRIASPLFGAAGLMLICCALGYYGSGYHLRADQSSTIADLRYENLQLANALQQTRREVTGLEEVMTELAQSDYRLRALHNMELDTEDARLGGIGGFSEFGVEELPEEFAFLPARKRSLVEDIKTRVFRLRMEASFQEVSYDQIARNYRLSEEGRRALPTISPVPRDLAWKSSKFGPRIDPFTGRKARHFGLDLAGRRGTKVIATADGQVIHSYHDNRLGNVIVIKHDLRMTTNSGEDYTLPGTFRTEYGHLEKMFVKKGVWVERGQTIGTMGNTGRSTGPHLHYAVRYQNSKAGGRNGYLDPEDFILDWPEDNRVAGWLSAAAGG